VQRFGWRSRKQAYPGLASALLHVVVIALFLHSPAGRSPGAAGAAEGAGIDVVLVSQASLGLAAPRPPPMDAMVTSPPPTPPPAPASAPAATDAGPSEKLFSADDRPPSPALASPAQTTAWAATGTSRLAATQDDERRGAKDSAGGDPAAASELLARIARCLPPQMRPRLPAHRLVVRIGPTGALTAAPVIDSVLPLLTADARAEADRVVQAALQCGPYAAPDLSGRVVSVAMDFSALQSQRP